MKKTVISIIVIVITFIIYLLIKIVCFNKTVPTGDENGEIPTMYSSRDMVGNWDLSIYKELSNNVIERYVGTMNITSFAGRNFYGSISFKEVSGYDNKIKGDTLNIEGTLYNDVVTIHFEYEKEKYNLNYEAKFNPKVLNNFLTLELNDKAQEKNNTYEYKFLLMRKEKFNNEK